MKEIFNSPYSIIYVPIAYLIVGVIYSIIFYCYQCYKYKHHFRNKSSVTFDDFVEAEAIEYRTFLNVIGWLPMLIGEISYDLIYIPIKYLYKQVGKLIRNIFKV